MRLAFALVAVLAVLALFVLDGPAGGVTALAAMVVFILACIGALRGRNADVGGRADRAGLGGWMGGWF